MANIAETTAEMLTASVSMGAVAIVPAERRKKNGSHYICGFAADCRSAGDTQGLTLTGLERPLLRG